MADPTTDDVSTIAQRLAMSYGSHVSPPEGGQDWRAAESLMPWLAQRDARVRAEALREAAGQAEWEFRRMSFTRGDGCTSHTELHPVGAWLRDRAAATERGESR